MYSSYYNQCIPLRQVEIHLKYKENCKFFIFSDQNVLFLNF